ncbi:MAG: hypothetical protein KC636_15800, partial [Myxococcales bacterium]|nr:hypothetical protein [Myxococcales bacterium]
AIEEARGRVATGKRRSGEPFTEAELAAARAEINAANDGLTKMRDTPLVPPTRAVAARETLEIGGVSLQLIPVSAHTDGDLLVYVAGARALISGDVVDALPFAGHGHPSAWIAALDQLKALDVAVVLPGHGPVFRGRDQLDRVRRLLVALVEHARAGAAAGESLEALQASLSLDELRAELVRDDTDARAFTRFVPEGLAAAYREATAP